MPARLGGQLQVQADDVGARDRARRDRARPRSRPPVPARASPRGPRRPRACRARVRNRATSAPIVAVADDPECPAVQLPPDRRLPRPGPQRDGVRSTRHGSRGEDQRQRQLRRRVRRARRRCRRRCRARCTRRGRCGASRGPSGRSAAESGSSSSSARVDRRSLADQDERLGVADLRRPLGDVLDGRSECTTTSCPASVREAVEPLDRPLVVLHHDDAHRATYRGAADGPEQPGIPHGCYDFA